VREGGGRINYYVSMIYFNLISRDGSGPKSNLSRELF